jgi:hypothetical protein
LQKGNLLKLQNHSETLGQIGEIEVSVDKEDKIFLKGRNRARENKLSARKAVI